MFKHIAIGITALALIGPATASAEPFTPELEADYSAALAWWGVTAPPQCASVTREILPADIGATDGIEAAARASQPPPGAYGLPCVLYVYANHMYAGCTEEIVLRHEVGHLLGLGHSEDPASIMYFGVNSPQWCPTPEGLPTTASPPATPPAVAEPFAMPVPVPVYRHLRKKKRCARHSRLSCAYPVA